MLGIDGWSEVFRWSAIGGLETILSRHVLDSLLLAAGVDPAIHIGLLSVAAVGGEVFAVGGNGTVLRLGEGGWSNDTVLSLQSNKPDPSRAAVLWRIASDGDSVYTVSAEAVYSRNGSVWRPVLDTISAADGCVPLSVAAAEARLWVAGGTPPCVKQRRNGRWAELPVSLATGFFGDMERTDTGAVAWDERGAFVRLEGQDAKVYRTELKNLEGILSIDQHQRLVFVASSPTESTVYSLILGELQ